LRATPLGDDDQVRAGGLLVAVGSGDEAVVADDRPRLEHVERLALGQPLDDVDEDDVGVVPLGEALGEGGADVAGSDDGDLGAHDESPALVGALGCLAAR